MVEVGTRHLAGLHPNSNPNPNRRLAGLHPNSNPNPNRRLAGLHPQVNHFGVGRHVDPKVQVGILRASSP